MSVPGAWGLDYTEVLGLTWLAYKGNSSTGSYAIGQNSWHVDHIEEKGSFRAIIASGKTKVLSLAGTDDAGDWVDNASQGLTGLSWQYAKARRLANAHGVHVVVGHSLGGGMATYCGVFAGKKVATVNPASLNRNLFSLIGQMKNSDLVINYVATGEILDTVQLTVGWVAGNRVGKIIRVGSNAAWYDLVGKHGVSNMEGFIQPTKQ